MALARLVTRTPELAQQLARSLEAAGYSVEFASPETSALQPRAAAELEVDLDDPSAAASYVVTGDGKEIYFAYDPCEREFVLAPLWRKVTAAFAPLMENLKRAAESRAAARREAFRLEQERLESQRIENERLEKERGIARAEAARIEAARLEAARLEAVRVEAARLEAARLEAERIESAQIEAASMIESPRIESARLEAERIEAEKAEVESPAAPIIAEPVHTGQSLYLPEPTFFAVEAEPEIQPVEFSGAEYFDGRGTRKFAEHHVPSAEQPVELMPESEALPDVTAHTPWLVTAALRAEALRLSLAARLRTQWNSHRDALAAKHSRLHAYDVAWLRAVPVAALITLAFLLGWASSTAQRTPAPPEVNPAAAKPLSVDPAIDAVAASDISNLHKASIIPVPEPKVAPTPATSTKVTPKRSARRAAADHDDDGYEEDGEDSDIAPDVVVRHHPAKAARSDQASQKPSVKRFSDLD